MDNPKWYVVSIKTGFGEGISDVDFELFGNRKSGDYAYGYGSHGIYGFCDPLYLEAGISVDVGGDKMIQGFTMTYAPKIWENIELPRLKANPNVTKITTIDPKTGVEKIIFER